jgi:hypothetical protein
MIAQARASSPDTDPGASEPVSARRESPAQPLRTRDGHTQAPADTELHRRIGPVMRYDDDT